MHSNHEILETISMIEEDLLDIRTVTMGISLLDCADPDVDRAAAKIKERIVTRAGHLVDVCRLIEAELGIPIVNKRISVTPISLVAAASDTDDYTVFAHALDDAAREVGVDFLGGFSALADKSRTHSDRRLIASIPQALAETKLVCSSVNVGTSRSGINMSLVRDMGPIIKDLAERTDGQGPAKLVVFANAVDDNPFMVALSTASVRAIAALASVSQARAS